MSWNYCRNPTGDTDGPFCFVAVQNNSTELQVKKEYCDVPHCQGTGVSFTLITQFSFYIELVTIRND